MIKIFLDDKRPFPEDKSINCVRTYGDCAELIRYRYITFISLDYDLGEEKTGLDVLEYMVECGCEVKHINIHSNHSVGVPKMREYAVKYFPDAVLTFNQCKS